MYHSSLWLLSSAARARSSPKRARKATQSASSRWAPASTASYTQPEHPARSWARRSGEKANTGERRTDSRGTSCRGLSTTCNREMATEISVVPKNSLPPSALQGMPASSRAAAYHRKVEPGERSKITMSSGRRGRSPMGSPEASSSFIRRATSRACTRSLFTLSSWSGSWDKSTQQSSVAYWGSGCKSCRPWRRAWFSS